jgi:hypothetical protein
MINTSVSAFNPGLTASLDIAVVEQAKDTYFDYIINEIRNLDMPDISFHDGHLRKNSFTIS